MKFVYVGDDNEPPEVTRPFGYTFHLHGDPVDVTDSDAIVRLRGNKCFREVRAKRKKDGLDES